MPREAKLRFFEATLKNKDVVIVALPRKADVLAMVRVSARNVRDMTDVPGRATDQQRVMTRPGQMFKRSLLHSRIGKVSWSAWSEYRMHPEYRTPRQVLSDALCRAIAPGAWAEFDHREGVCTFDVRNACLDSVHAAARVIAALEEMGYPVPPMTEQDRRARAGRPDQDRRAGRGR